MAKTESSAVNALIDQVLSGKPQAADPGADLFAAPKSTSVQPPARMTSPIPPMRGAGEVAPLPRGRSPRATSQSPMSQLPVPVRMSTAEESSGNTIPPLARPASKPGTQRAASIPPPPRNTPRATSSNPVTRPSTLPPKNSPVAAPFEAKAENPFAARVPSLPSIGGYPVVKRPQTVDVTGDVVKAENWFDVSAAVHKLDPADGTHIVPRPHRETLSLIKKMIVPTIILAIIGVMVGGFFAFDGDGGKKKKTSAAPAAAVVAPEAERRVAMTAAPNVPATADVAQPEPPTKAEEVAKQEAAAAEAAAQQAAEPAKSESMFPAATTAVISRDAPATAKAEPKAEAPKPEAPKPEAPKPEVKAAPAAAPAPAAAAPAAEVVAVKAMKTSSEPALVREVRTARGVVKLVDIRIDSKPSGATVMLVDNGKTSFLGTTPLATSIDPSRKYDVIFTLQGRPTQMAPLDPATTSRLDVTLGRAHRSSSSSSAKKEAAAPKLDAFVEKPAAKAEAPKAEAKVEKAEPKSEKKSAEPAGEGTLMVSSKPPCEILIDGKPTGLTTPQRSLPLSAGSHKITFVNAAEGINKTVSVSITADKSTKLIQDLMKK